MLEYLAKEIAPNIINETAYFILCTMYETLAGYEEQTFTWCQYVIKAAVGRCLTYICLCVCVQVDM